MQDICLPVAKCDNNVGYYFNHVITTKDIILITILPSSVHLSLSFLSAIPYSPGLVPLLLCCLAPLASFTPFFPHCHPQMSTFFSTLLISMKGQAHQLDLQRIWKALAALERPVWGQWAVKGPGGRLRQKALIVLDW